MKKLIVLLLSFTMVLAFTACGGGSSDSGSDSGSGEAAEPNTGLAGIVFSVPDSYVLDGSEPGSYISYKTGDSGYMLTASTITEENLAEMGDDFKGKSIQDFYKDDFLASDKIIKENNLKQDKIKVCGEDAYYVTAHNDNNEPFEVSTSWMMDNTIYSISLYYPVEYDEQGKPKTDKNDIPALSADQISEYESIQASIQAGDGSSLQPDGLSVDSLGDVSFETPEGYSVNNYDEHYVHMANRDNGNYLSLHMVDEGEFEQMGWEGEGAPANLDEYFESCKVDSEAVEVAGGEGYISKYPEEDGKIYQVNASFRADGDEVYEVSLSTDAWDENGLKADAVPLSDEDMAVFNDFLASIQKK